jgi:signal transduction histidine kinase
LGAIQLSALALASKLPTVVATNVEHHAKLVGRNTERMTRLISDLLDAAALDAGQISIQPEDEDAAALAEEAVELSRPQAASEKKELRAGVVEPVIVRCDHARVLQVLSNLIGNAIKFSPEGGEVVVGVERAANVARFLGARLG